MYIVCSQYSAADIQKMNNCDELIFKKSESKIAMPESRPSAGRNEQLILGATKSFEIIANRRMNYSGIFLEEGTYIFTFSRLEDWCDGSMPAGVYGWLDQSSLLSWSHWISRFPSGHLFTVIGGIHGQWLSRFDMGVVMGNRETYSVTQGNEGELYAFANDIYFMYSNNYGRVTILIERID
jgi:hypothetical protein